MCDTLCLLGDGVTLFAKNSDRPVTEAQVVEAHGRRSGGGQLRTQYLEIDDTGAAATILSRPAWLWGAEHGVNEHGVAIGNELVDTVDDPRLVPPALLGMDLVRLGLERARDATEAVDVITTLLERHGQGGVGDEVHGLAYWSSFLVADARVAWVLETSGRRWAARPLVGGGAISNRLTLRSDWTRASADVAPGTDVDSWRDPGVATGFADGRLAASQAFVARATPPGRGRDPRSAAAHLRDHGSGPWGAPGSAGPVVDPPADVLPDGTGVTVCMHVRDFEATTASMVAELVAEGTGPRRAWVALGNPCASVFVPVALFAAGSTPGAVPGCLGRQPMAARFAALGRAVERVPGALAAVHAVLDPIEAALWDEAEALGADPARWLEFGRRSEGVLVAGLDALARAGLGRPA